MVLPLGQISTRLAAAAVSLLAVFLLCTLCAGGARGAGPSPYCPHPNELMRVSKRAALRYAMSGLSEKFAVRAAHHPRRGDIGWTNPALPGGGFSTCARRVDRLTWYFDLHPPGSGSCHACDSHVYVVRYRGRRFAILKFSG